MSGIGRNVHRDVNEPAPKAALRHDADAARIRCRGSNLQQLQHRFQIGRTLTVLAGRIEQVGDDPREAEFVVAEVAEDVEAAREVAIQFAFDRAGGVQRRGQLLQKTDAGALTALPDALHIVQKANAILVSSLPNLFQVAREPGDGVHPAAGPLIRRARRVVLPPSGIAPLDDEVPPVAV